MLSNDRITNRRSGNLLTLGVAAAALCYAGGIACVDANGNLTPGAVGAKLRGVGVFTDRADNSGGNAGDISATAEQGIFQFANSAGGDAISAANIGDLCYVVDDQTVALTNNAGTRGIAGKVHDVDANGVWVDFREAYGTRKAYVGLQAVDLVAADTAVYRTVAPVAGLVTKIFSVLEGHIVVAGDATLTSKIGATAITAGVVTHALVGTAIGEVKTATPTALNACNAGDVISVTVGGANTNNAATARLVAEISY